MQFCNLKNKKNKNKKTHQFLPKLGAGGGKFSKQDPILLI